MDEQLNTLTILGWHKTLSCPRGARQFYKRVRLWVIQTGTAASVKSELRGIKTRLQGDVYALGLVIWEVTSRVSTPLTPCPPAQPPYWDLVGVDPSLDEMRKVCPKNKYCILECVFTSECFLLLRKRSKDLSALLLFWYTSGQSYFNNQVVCSDQQRPELPLETSVVEPIASLARSAIPKNVQMWLWCKYYFAPAVSYMRWRIQPSN